MNQITTPKQNTKTVLSKIPTPIKSVTTKFDSFKDYYQNSMKEKLQNPPQIFTNTNTLNEIAEEEKYVLSGNVNNIII